jgi:predicted nucleic acid-binding protein
VICFFDTNILIYMLDSNEPERQPKAIACFEDAVLNHTIVLSTQVLHEFYNITTRKLRLSPADAAQRVHNLCAFEIMASASPHTLAALELVQRYKLQWWDALVLEAAMRAKADVLYSEDKQHGQRYGDLRVVNPFLG